MFKKFVSLLMTYIMALSFSLSVMANEGLVYTVDIDGIKYQIQEKYDLNADKIVQVIGNNEEITVLNDGKFLNINVSSIKAKTHDKKYVIEIQEEQPNVDRRSVYKSSLYWNYSYLYSAYSRDTYWSLSSGNDSGSWSGFVDNRTTAEDYAYDFCSSVRELDSAQWAAGGVAVEEWVSAYNYSLDCNQTFSRFKRAL